MDLGQEILKRHRYVYSSKILNLSRSAKCTYMTVRLIAIKLT